MFKALIGKLDGNWLYKKGHSFSHCLAYKSKVIVFDLKVLAYRTRAINIRSRLVAALE